MRRRAVRASGVSYRLPYALLPLLALVSGVCGCTVLTSELPSQLAADGRMPAGVYYALPRGVVPVKLTVATKTGRYFVALMDPQFMPDPNHRYLMRYQPLPNYSDQITIEVNDRGFPKAVNVTTTDETAQIILNLAKFFGEISRQAGSPATGANDLVTLNLDPTKEEEVARGADLLDEKMRRHATKAFADCTEALKTMQDSDASKADLKIACARFGKVAAGNGVHAFIKVHSPSHIVAGTPSNCSVGLCYRIKEPYIIEYGIGDYKHVSVVELPNRAVPIELDIARAFLVTKIQNISFDDDGFLKEVHIEKPSELLEAAKLPVAVVSAVADGLAIKADVITQQKNVAEQELARLQAQTALVNAH